MNLSKPTWQILQIFLAWRITTILITLVITSTFNMINPLNSFGEINILKLWGNWDGGHYIGIAEHGYAHIMQYAFFPLYPILIKTVHFLIPDVYLTALLISNLALLGALLMLYKLAKLYDLADQAALKTIMLLLLFPSSFFLGAAYAESLLLLLIISALYYAKTNQWFKASLFAGLATFTKFIAVIILVVLFLEYLQQKKITFKNIWQKLKSNYIDPPLLYLVLFGPLGIYLYSLYSFWATGYWFFFRDAQMHWGRSATILNPITVLINNGRQFLLADNFGYPNLGVHSLEVLTIIIFIVLTPFIYKRYGFALAFFSFIITIFTLLSGKVESSIRYILTAFPFFMLFAEVSEKNQTINFILILLFTSLSTILLTLFLTGNWAG